MLNIVLAALPARGNNFIGNINIKDSLLKLNLRIIDCVSLTKYGEIYGSIAFTGYVENTYTLNWMDSVLRVSVEWIFVGALPR